MQVRHDLFRLTRWGTVAMWPRSVQEGFAHAQSQRMAREHPDRFERKCLQLRLGAFMRGLPFDADVAQRPVTREALSHGEQLGTDWSVDRLNNDGAYAPDNLAVMSTRVNVAKSNRSFEQVPALSEREVPSGGLLPIEWLRLAGAPAAQLVGARRMSADRLQRWHLGAAADGVRKGGRRGATM